MNGRMARRLAEIGILVFGLTAGRVEAQKKTLPGPNQATQVITVEQVDADQVKRQFDEILNRCPPNVRGVFKEDPSLMAQPQYVAPFPALANFLTEHPEIAHNPSFYLDGLGHNNWERPLDHAGKVLQLWENFMAGVAVITGFAMAIGLLTWLIRTFIDYRRWNRLSKLQSEVHTRLLDRFNTNEELLAYMATPAGSKFLQSAPISLDTGTPARTMGAPLNRIMWSLQAGLVLAALGVGLMYASQRVIYRDASDPLHVLGIVALALGGGFAVSAVASWVLSTKMGLFDQESRKRTQPEIQ